MPSTTRSSESSAAYAAALMRAQLAFVDLPKDQRDEKGRNYSGHEGVLRHCRTTLLNFGIMPEMVSFEADVWSHPYDPTPKGVARRPGGTISFVLRLTHVESG